MATMFFVEKGFAFASPFLVEQIFGSKL